MKGRMWQCEKVKTKEDIVNNIPIAYEYYKEKYNLDVTKILVSQKMFDSEFQILGIKVFPVKFVSRNCLWFITDNK